MSISDPSPKGIQKSRPAGALQTSTDAARLIGSIIEGAVAKSIGQSTSQTGVDLRPARTVHVDRDMLRELGFLPPESQGHELAVQYQVIKRPLILNAFGPQEATGAPRRLIMVTSALPGDGKTFNCINIALSMALERDLSVVLVDGDPIKPEISRRFGMRHELGLLDVLDEPNRSVESLICPTDVPRLSILPAGQRTQAAAELIASGRLREVCHGMIDRYPKRIVLFDSSPILLTSEARALASLVGQIVLVVKAGITPQQAVKDAIEILGIEKRVSLVLNQVDLSGAMGYYHGHHYGRSYRVHSDHESGLP